MLTSLHVQNFKCLRDVKVEFGPLTVLIGPNDSGKSSILDALRLLGRTAVEPVGEVFKGADEWRQLVWKGSTPPGALMLSFGARGVEEWVYRLVLAASTVAEQVSLVSGTQPQDSPRRVVPLESLRYTELSECLSNALTNTGWRHDGLLEGFVSQCADVVLRMGSAPRFRLSPDWLRSPAVPAPEAVLSDTGDNLVAVLDRLITGPDRSAIARLEQALHDAVPTLRGIALRTVDGKTGAKSLEFVLDTGATKGPPVTIPCAHASDGAMLLTAFLALAFSDEPGLLLIEEPENGLHPSRLQSVVEMLRKISTGEVGNQPRQVILTTHSPLLLNYTRPEEVRIVQRDREKGTSVTPMSEVPDVHKLLEEFGAGELWYLLGEQGLVEGKKP